MQRLLEIMRRLRGPDGCPWDREQTHDSLRPYLLEEAAEAADVLHTDDAERMSEELGDVLLQVAFHAVIAEEAGTFGYDAIETSIVDKLVRRHPHVFGEVEVADADEVLSNWQAIKAAEKAAEEKGASAVPNSLPALMRAQELGKTLGWPALSEEDLAQRAASAAPTAESVGELLLGVVDYARACGVNAELALRDAAAARADEA